MGKITDRRNAKKFLERKKAECEARRDEKTAAGQTRAAYVHEVEARRYQIAIDALTPKGSKKENLDN